MSAPQRAVAELHLHLEGSVSIESAIELAAARGLPWGELTPAGLRRRFRYDSFVAFLLTVRDMAQVLSAYDALERCSFELSGFLAASGVRYAEVYVSPYIYARWGLDGAKALLAADRGFARGESAGLARCAILLDAVRHWGVETASTVLDIHEQARCERVVGFGLGGDESVPLRQFAEVFRRARSLGMHLVTHAGETSTADDVREAVEILEVERIAHGIRAVDDDGLLAEIRTRGIALDLAVTSNYRTGAVRGAHPIRRLLDAGVAVTLSTDDPSLFRIDLPREFRRVRRLCDVSGTELAVLARNGVEHSFASEAEKAELRSLLAARA